MQDRQTAVVTAALVALVPLASPTPSAALHLLGAPLDPAAPTGPVLAVVGLVAWALVSWLVVGALLVLAGRLPGLAGRLAGAAAARALPGSVRRGLELALGASLVVGTVGASPAAAVVVERGDRGSVTRMLPGAGDLHLDWPTTRPTATTPALPAVVDPAAAPATPPASAAGSPGPAAPAPVAPAPAAPAPPAAVAPGQAASVPGAARTAPTGRPAGVPAVVTRRSAVVVQPGDSLWLLAARELRAAGIAPTEAAVAARWPAWWGANRAVVGADPDLLRPGTALLPPST